MEPGLYEIPATMPGNRRPVYVVNQRRDIVAVYFQRPDEPDADVKEKLAAIVNGEKGRRLTLL